MLANPSIYLCCPLPGRNAFLSLTLCLYPSLQEKITSNKREQAATGGGPSTLLQLTTWEETVLELVGVGQSEGVGDGERKRWKKAAR